MKSFFKISQQTFWQILGKAVTSLSTLLVLSLVARNYGEAGTGIFTLSLTYLAIFYLLSDFGFNAHVLKKVSNLPSAEQSSEFIVHSEWNKLFGTRILWSVFLVILSISILPLSPFTNAEFSQASIFGSLAILFSGIFVTCNLLFQQKLNYQLSTLSSSIGTIFGLALFAYLILNNYSIPHLLLAHLLSWVVTSVSALFLVIRFFGSAVPIFSARYVSSLFKASWPIALTLALNVIYFRADSFMIAAFKSTSDVGIYNLAYSVFQNILVLPTFIMNSYYPLMLKNFKSIKLIGFTLVGLSLFALLLTAFFSSLIIKILAGGSFLGAIPSLQILSLGFPAYFLSALLMWVFISKGMYKLMVLIYAIGLGFNIVANFYFIPQYSYLASSWITILSEYLILTLQGLILFRRWS